MPSNLKSLSDHHHILKYRRMTERSACSTNGNLLRKEVGEAQERGKSRGLPPLKLKRRVTALLVDGGKTCQLIQEGILMHYGVETQVVGNGRDAVNLFASGSDFDLLVIDMSLPILNGLEATRQIRGMGMRRKIVGIAAYGYEEERRAFMDAGADEFFEKPVPPDQLVRILREIDNS